jgi:uncharacterized protein (TIGR00269 family)
MQGVAANHYNANLPSDGVVKCSKCGLRAVTFIRYNGTHLCHQHFVEYVEKRVKREIRKQLPIEGEMKIAIGLSGGKDSSVALVMLQKILEDRRDVEIHAISVDEGIEGYRPHSLEKAAELTEELGVQHHIIYFQDEFGTSMDAIAPHSGFRTPCTFCGVLRRKCLNKKAMEIGANVIATGLNLDDTVQSIMMNFTRGDVERLARLGPHVKVQPGLIPRIQPLRSIPEKESYLYAILEGIGFSDDTCPYSDPALRNDYRDIIDSLENRSPGSRFSILASYDAIAPLLRESYPPAKLNTCQCGEPSLGTKCKACELLDELNRTDQTKS